MAKATTIKARKLQEQIAREGAIVGTVAAVRAIIEDILEDTRFRHLFATYSANANPAPGKEPGTPYTLLVVGKGPTKGIQSADQVLTRIVDNNLINVYACDGGRRAYRSPKVPNITAIEVYSGRLTPDPKAPGKMKAEKVTVPVVTVKVV